MNKNEILELISIIIEMNKWLLDAKEKNILAKHIQFLKTPHLMSQSLVLNLLQDKTILEEIGLESLRLGGKDADIVALLNKKKIHIEVKATASGFQYLGKKDIVADYLIWVDLENPLRKDNNKIEIYLVPSPSEFFVKPRKIMLKKFKEITKPKIKELDIIEYLKKKK